MQSDFTARDIAKSMMSTLTPHARLMIGSRSITLSLSVGKSKVTFLLFGTFEYQAEQAQCWRREDDLFFTAHNKHCTAEAKAFSSSHLGVRLISY